MSVRRSVGSALRTPVAIGYLLIVAAVGVWVAVDLHVATHPEADFAGVWLFFLTAPTSLPFVVLPSGLALIGVPVGALVQAAVLGAAYRGLTRHRRLGTS
jgi:hypothetical protein